MNVNESLKELVMGRSVLGWMNGDGENCEMFGCLYVGEFVEEGSGRL